jgi:hypothetical protein
VRLPPIPINALYRNYNNPEKTRKEKVGWERVAGQKVKRWYYLVGFVRKTGREYYRVVSGGVPASLAMTAWIAP